MSRRNSIYTLALTAILGAIAAILMSFEISIPFMPAPLREEFSQNLHN
ncbi:MAG: hypothetical protein IJM63_02805 [Solobacterium sp.]|nr:hypothetical protein [Solobacterium sp.]